MSSASSGGRPGGSPASFNVQLDASGLRPRRLAPAAEPARAEREAPARGGRRRARSSVSPEVTAHAT
eukprot:15520335-Heterocapsa_arctica.AAC.1